MNILLCCSAGMSTSLLVNKMKEYAKTKGIEANIWAVSTVEVKDHIDKADVLLLGPQVKFEYNGLKPIADEHGVKIAVINMMDYGTMRGDKVFEEALKLMEQ